VADDKTFVPFRGGQVIEGWPEALASAQLVTTTRVGEREVARVRYGEEEDDWGANSRPCHDCYAIKGEFHVEGCDVERCPGCGGQRFNCDCEPCDEA
jgi:hypothetical protein